MQPLTPKQVSTYLSSGGDSFAVLQESIRHDAALQELTGSPLMLSVMSLAYRDGVAARIADTASTSVEARTRLLFQTYLAQMLGRGSVIQPFIQERTLRWLTWLARQMTESSQSLFLIEKMQPGWLRDQNQRRLHMLGVILLAGLPIGVLFGLGVDLPVMWSGPEGIGRELGILAGLAAALTITLMVRRIFGPGASALVGASLGIAFGWSFSMVYDMPTGVAFGLAMAVGCGLAYWFTGRQLSRRGHARHDEIITIEKLDWSPAKGGFGAAAGLACGIVAGLAMWLAIRGDDYIPGFGLWFVLTLGISAGLIVAVLVGFTGDHIETRIAPNQGIRRSAQNAVRVGLALWVAVGLPLGLISSVTWRLALGGYAYWGDMSWPVGLAIGIFIGGAFGLTGALLFGGQACIQHWLLRWLLHRSDDFPWGCIAFLDYSVERILMRRVGGGYIFIHRLLQEYLAELDT